MRTGTPHHSPRGWGLKVAREASNAGSQCKLRNRLRTVTRATQRNASSRRACIWKHDGDSWVQVVQTPDVRALRSRTMLLQAGARQRVAVIVNETARGVRRRVIDDLAELVPPHDLYVSSNLDHSR